MSALFDNSHSDTDDNDSFHSFNQSEDIMDNLSLSISERDCDSAADLDSGSADETFVEEMASRIDFYIAHSIDAPALAQGAGNTSKPTRSGVFVKTKSPVMEVHSSDSSACDGVSAGKATQAAGRFKSPKKFTISPISEQKPGLVPCCPRAVPKHSSNQIPCMEHFDLDHSVTILKDHLISNPETEALQKHAFTEIWIDSQRKRCQAKVSRLQQFSMALEAYFAKDFDKKDLEPAKTITPPPKSDKSVEKVYVSPFPNIPITPPARKETPMLSGVKPPIIVPAGFDLTRLVEFNNPNHWHRRPHMRTGDSI
ncbi:GM24896 [Drosophila sechellia]|uniref:GM24896 n=1 Tax=Drosophila sechellia TaxID=7238 RepID=B4HKK0_DROSE|nr:GM24896 [Drosophila sechellia]